VNVIVNEDGCGFGAKPSCGLSTGSGSLEVSAGCLPAQLTLRLVRAVACCVPHLSRRAGRRRVCGTEMGGAVGRWAQDAWGPATQRPVRHRPRRTPAGEETAGFGGQLAAAGQPLVPMPAPADLSVPNGTVRRVLEGLDEASCALS